MKKQNINLSNPITENSCPCCKPVKKKGRKKFIIAAATAAAIGGAWVGINLANRRKKSVIPSGCSRYKLQKNVLAYTYKNEDDPGTTYEVKLNLSSGIFYIKSYTYISDNILEDHKEVHKEVHEYSAKLPEDKLLKVRTLVHAKGYDPMRLTMALLAFAENDADKKYEDLLFSSISEEEVEDEE